MRLLLIQGIHSENSRQSAIIKLPTSQTTHFPTGPRPILSESKPDPYPPSKPFVLLLHLFDVPLFLADLSVLCHILQRGEIVVVASIDLRVESRYEWGGDRTQVVPFDTIEEGVTGDLRQGGVSDACVRE